MSFISKLKKAFIYNGEQEDTDDKVVTKEEDINTSSIRFNIGNPLERIKVVKNEVSEVMKEHSPIEKPKLTNHTKNIVYDNIHYRIETSLKKNKPKEEARLLYKRFMEDKVTDSGMYSEIDLMYIKELVAYIKLLKREGYKESERMNREDIILGISNNKYFLSIVEFLDLYFSYSIMDKLCESSYIICGYRYNNNISNMRDSFNKMKLPHFDVEINGNTFILLNEVGSLISNKHTTEEKEVYVNSKLTALFLKSNINEAISTHHLYIVSELFNNKIDTGYIEEPVKEQVNLKEDIVEVVDVSEEDFSDKIFEGIQRDLNPISELEEENKFLNIYKPLSDLRNPDVSMEELEEAIEEIDKMVYVELKELTQEEFKVYSSIKSRLTIMQRTNGGD